MKLCAMNAGKICCVIILLALTAGCTVKLVQPYDADLYANTEEFYKKASSMITKGITVSPKKPDDIRAIPVGAEEQHPGHYKHFKDDYESLLIDSNSLILRSLANSGEIDSIGMEIQGKIEKAITSNLPSTCDSLHADFSNVSLTTRNYIDLKCIIGKWEVSHQGNDPKGDITYGRNVLKRSNWEGRAKTLFEGILSIQKAESSKKSK